MLAVLNRVPADAALRIPRGIFVVANRLRPSFSNEHAGHRFGNDNHITHIDL